VTEPTEQLVPLADVYVASISATIRWALALGIPVINYDCYRYRYDDYQDAAGMLLVEDQHAFAAALQRIATDADYRQALGARQAGDRANWGCIDSQFAVRFLALLKALCGLAIEQPDGTRGGEAAGPALRPQGLVSRP
jgi:glycosyltransferase involved in cell wall biosynthesis